MTSQTWETTAGKLLTWIWRSPASLSDVQGLVATYRNVAICNINAPGQIVVGGPTDEIDRLVADVSGRRVPAKRLPVSAAFEDVYA